MSVDYYGNKLYNGDFAVTKNFYLYNILDIDKHKALNASGKIIKIQPSEMVKLYNIGDYLKEQYYNITDKINDIITIDNVIKYHVYCDGNCDYVYLGIGTLHRDGDLKNKYGHIFIKYMAGFAHISNYYLSHGTSIFIRKKFIYDCTYKYNNNIKHILDDCINKFNNTDHTILNNLTKIMLDNNE